MGLNDPRTIKQWPKERPQGKKPVVAKQPHLGKSAFKAALVVSLQGTGCKFAGSCPSVH